MMKSHNYSFPVLVSIILLSWICSSPLSAQEIPVRIINRGNYYQVTLNYNSGVSHYDMGKQLMQIILQEIPDYEQLVDSYIAEIVSNQNNYDTLLVRVEDIKPQMHQVYRDEIEGMASQLNGGDTNIPGDNLLSKNELYFLQLLTDVYRSTQCTGISIYGPRSQSGNTMTARILDWYDGANHQLTKLQSVTTIYNNNKSICIIGYLGHMGIITGFNSNGVFTGILDSPTGVKYSSTNKYSYSSDLRYALENYTTLSDVAVYLSNSSRNYSFNHLILLSDNQTSKVLENNFSGTGTNIRRVLRSDTSALNPGITWEYPNAIATVNSFLLRGNYDNHTDVLSNINRWNSIKTYLQNDDGVITIDELKEMASFDNNNGPGHQSDGDIYNGNTQQIVIFQPDIFHLEIAFKPKSGILPDDPVFENVPVEILTSIDVNDLILPELFILKQNYPNPFNPSTKIEFSIPSDNNVVIKVYNVLGMSVATLLNEHRKAGTYNIQFDGSNLSSGIYFCNLQAGNYTVTRKMILAK